jgi:voltage-gated potassium channel Kch
MPSPAQVAKRAWDALEAPWLGKFGNLLTVIFAVSLGLGAIRWIVGPGLDIFTVVVIAIGAVGLIEEGVRVLQPAAAPMREEPKPSLTQQPAVQEVTIRPGSQVVIYKSVGQLRNEGRLLKKRAEHRIDPNDTTLYVGSTQALFVEWVEEVRKALKREGSSALIDRFMDAGRPKPPAILLVGPLPELGAKLAVLDNYLSNQE